jgi:hypothetical protein
VVARVLDRVNQRQHTGLAVEAVAAGHAGVGIDTDQLLIEGVRAPETARRQHDHREVGDGLTRVAGRLGCRIGGVVDETDGIAEWVGAVEAAVAPRPDRDPTIRVGIRHGRTELLGAPIRGL